MAVGYRAAGYSCQGVCSRRGLQGRSCSRRRTESGQEAVEPKGWLTGLIPERPGQAAASCLRIGIENSRPINFRFVPT
jgi:hypothetical protein